MANPSDIIKTRTAVTNVYPTKAWSDKVKAMADDQVTAIYLRLKAQKKLP